MARTLDPIKRLTILKSARTIFLRDGYDIAKMSDIAADAGVAPGTLYLYFPSKQALASAIGEDFFNRLSNQFGQVIRKLTGAEGVEALVEWALKIGIQERDILSLVKEQQHACSKDSLKTKEQGRQKFVSQLAEVLQSLMTQGIVRNYESAHNLADFVLVVIHRVVLSQAIFEDADSDQVKGTAIAILQHSLFEDSELIAANKSAATRSMTRGSKT